MKEQDKPLKKIRLGGICVTIWRNTQTNQKGFPFVTESIELDRSYKDQNGEWQNTTRMRKEDLLKSALALQKAYEFLATSQAAETPEEPMTVDEERVG